VNWAPEKHAVQPLYSFTASGMICCVQRFKNAVAHFGPSGRRGELARIIGATGLRSRRQQRLRSTLASIFGRNHA
jgi:hypothetical protein